MCIVYLTVNEQGHAMYHDQWEFLGRFESFLAAATKLGDDLLNRCTVRVA